jgi:hypothetical protein
LPDKGSHPQRKHRTKAACRRQGLAFVESFGRRRSRRFDHAKTTLKDEETIMFRTSLDGQKWPRRGFSLRMLAVQDAATRSTYHHVGESLPDKGSHPQRKHRTKAACRRQRTHISQEFWL